MNDTPDDNTLLEWMRAYTADPRMIADDALRARVQAALEDPAMRRRMGDEEDFDRAFRESLHAYQPPPGLLTRILVEQGAAAAGPRPAAEDASRGRWFHFGAFGAAAAALVAVAVSLTFFQPAAGPEQPVAATEAMRAGFSVERFVNSIESAVQSPVEARRVAHLSEAYSLLSSHGINNPSAPPAGLRDEDTVTCRVLENEGMKIAMICFQTDDGIVHMFTFPARDIANRETLTSPGGRPVLRSVGDHSVASWVRDEEVHMLLSRMDLAKLASRL
ncbi:MAG: hypothetical protein JJU00_01545 [Opitutales bacterium]|nr:hypothetical protein [Opitutales bacterium]